MSKSNQVSWSLALLLTCVLSAGCQKDRSDRYDRPDDQARTSSTYPTSTSTTGMNKPREANYPDGQNTARTGNQGNTSGMGSTANTGNRQNTGMNAGDSDRSVAGVLRNWPAKPKEAAEQLISRYGNPSEISPTRLTWTNKGTWREITLSREEIPHDWPMPHTDFLEQVVNFDVPAEKYSELAKFDGSVFAERTKGTLAARCDKEENNILALNLAHEIISGEKSAEDARREFEETAMAAMRGEKPEKMARLMFEPQRSKTGDRDSAAKPAAGAGR
jgi:hypothetical protein